MKVQLQAIAATLTPEEIKSAVPPSVLSEIKKKDPTPTLRAYSIVQEGTSRPRVIGEGIKPITWTRDAISAVGDVIKRGLQFFKGHNADNSHTNRTSLGEVVGKLTKEISGKLNQIVVGYFPSKEKTADCDICSIEADAVLREGSNNTYIADAIENLTGIALGNSQADTPGFPGAIRLGSIQAFEESKEPEPPQDVKENKKEGDSTMSLTFDQVKKAVIDMNIFPNQLYNEAVLRNDNVFGKLFTDKESLAKELEKMKETSKSFEDKYNELYAKEQGTAAASKLPSYYPAGITDEQKSFITTLFTEKTPSNLTDEGLREFVNSGLKEYKTYASIFGKTAPEGDETPVKPVTEEDAPGEGADESDDITAIVNDTLS